MSASSRRIETHTVQQTPDALSARVRLSGVMITILAFALSVVQGPLFGQVDSAAPGTVWHGSDGNPLPLQGHEEIKEFLLKARIVSSKRIGEGINNPLKVLLELDGVQMHAVFRDVSVRKSRVKLGNRYKLNFRDDAVFEVAAYELGRLLGLDNIPPAVKRRVKGEKGTLQLWIENAMTEKKRQAQRVAPQDEGSWYSQHQIMRVFDNLIYNEDRNQGNLLIDGGWKIWLIDHTRAFRRDKSLLNEALIRQCEKDLFENMQRLNESLIKKRLGRYLSPAEMKGLLIRRDLLVAYIDGLVAERGAERVFFDLPSVVIG